MYTRVSFNRHLWGCTNSIHMLKVISKWWAFLPLFSLNKLGPSEAFFCIFYFNIIFHAADLCERMKINERLLHPPSQEPSWKEIFTAWGFSLSNAKPSRIFKSSKRNFSQMITRSMKSARKTIFFSFLKANESSKRREALINGLINSQFTF